VANLLDLLQYVVDAQNQYEQQSPVAGVTRSLMPDLGTAAAIALPIGRGVGGVRGGGGPRQPTLQQSINSLGNAVPQPTLSLQRLFESPLESVQARSPRQQHLEGAANDRIDRLNLSNSKYGMPPIPYEGMPGRFTQQPILTKDMLKSGQRFVPDSEKKALIEQLFSGQNP
jgi:hypothetical protein